MGPDPNNPANRGPNQAPAPAPPLQQAPAPAPQATRWEPRSAPPPDRDALRMQQRQSQSLAYNQAQQNKAPANYSNPDSLAASYQAQMGRSATPASSPEEGRRRADFQANRLFDMAQRGIQDPLTTSEALAAQAALPRPQTQYGADQLLQNRGVPQASPIAQGGYVTKIDGSRVPAEDYFSQRNRAVSDPLNTAVPQAPAAPIAPQAPAAPAPAPAPPVAPQASRYDPLDASQAPVPPQTGGMPDGNAEIAGNLARSQYGQRPTSPVVNSPPGYTDPKPLGPYNQLKQATNARYNRARQYEAQNTSGFGTAQTSNPGARRPSMPLGGMRNNGVINWPQAGKPL